MLLAVLSEKKKNLAEIMGELPKYHTIQEKVKTEIGNVKKIVRKNFSGYKIKETGDETGGIKVWIDKNSWLWFRKSKTEPNVVRIIADSKSKERSEEMIEKGIRVLRDNK